MGRTYEESLRLIREKLQRFEDQTEFSFFEAHGGGKDPLHVTPKLIAPCTTCGQRPTVRKRINVSSNGAMGQWRTRVFCNCGASGPEGLRWDAVISWNEEQAARLPSGTLLSSEFVIAWRKLFVFFDVLHKPYSTVLRRLREIRTYLVLRSKEIECVSQLSNGLSFGLQRYQARLALLLRWCNLYLNVITEHPEFLFGTEIQGGTFRERENVLTGQSHSVRPFGERL